MDPATIETIANLVKTSGPVALFLAVWVAFKAGRVAQDAVKALEDIRDSIKESRPLLEQIAKDVEAIDDRTGAQNMKLDALVAGSRARANLT